MLVKSRAVFFYSSALDRHRAADCTGPGVPVAVPLGVMLHWECGARTLLLTLKTGALSRPWTHFIDKDRKGATLSPGFRCLLLSLRYGLGWATPLHKMCCSKGLGRMSGRGHSTALGSSFLSVSLPGASSDDSKIHCESLCTSGGDGNLGDIKCFPSLVSPWKRFARSNGMTLHQRHWQGELFTSKPHTVRTNTHCLVTTHQKARGGFLGSADVCDSRSAGRCCSTDISARAVTRRRSSDAQAAPSRWSRSASGTAGQHASGCSSGRPGSSSHDPGVNDS